MSLMESAPTHARDKIIDLSEVSVAILAGVQSRLKLQQMYGKLFNFQTL